MGLGKTAQSIATLEFQRQLVHAEGPFLIVAPLTTLPHWQREVETWTSMVRTAAACPPLAVCLMILALQSDCFLRGRH